MSDNLSNDPEALNAVASLLHMHEESTLNYAFLPDVVRYSDPAQLTGTLPQPNLRSIVNMADEVSRKYAKAHVTAASFVLLQPGLHVKVVAAALAEVPDALRAWPHDTRDVLVLRLSQCSELDNMLVLLNGNSLPRVRLNATDYAQPRRISWSVVVRGAHKDAEGDIVMTMYTYTFGGTEPDNWHARPMPMPIFQLGAHLFHAVRDRLSATCQHSPPTACQLLCYYTAFESDMRSHKDNFTLQDAIRAMEAMRTWGLTPQQAFEEAVRESKGTPSGGDENSQLMGSDVLVYTECNEPMLFELSFPNPQNPHGDKTTYGVDPCYSYPLENGSVFVFKGMDDLFFYHEARFSLRTRHRVGKQDGYRFAFVFRWLASERDFFVHNRCMKRPSSTSS